MIILVLNCGSSSIKYQVIDVASGSNSLLAKGLVERIGLTDGVLIHKPTDKPVCKITKSISDHTVGINMILNAIVDETHGVLESFADIKAVGHRVTHGGEYFSDSAIVTQTVKQQIESCIELAPLHNSANLKGVLAIENLLPTIQQVTVFDTSFYQTMPQENYLYAIPYKYYEEDRIRKYGFHGTSHKYVAKKACDLNGLDYYNSKIISCHLGNGASVTAIKNGKAFDTSMGFTPVDGLVMGTRCGIIDPSVLLYIAEKKEMGWSKMNNLINKESGILGIGGLSFDMRDNEAAAANGHKKAQLAIRMFTERIKKFIGQYAATMGGVDLIVFTGGIGENQYDVREAACEGLEFIGVKIDKEFNKSIQGIDAVISTPDSRVLVTLTPTDEEFVIASDTYRLLNLKGDM